MPRFEVKKSGDASVALVGFPSVGKSSLISQLTGAESEAVPCLHTTCIPGLMEHKGQRYRSSTSCLIKGQRRQGKRAKLNVIRGSDMVLTS